MLTHPTCNTVPLAPISFVEIADWLRRMTAEVYAFFASGFKTPLLDKQVDASEALQEIETVPCSPPFRPGIAYMFVGGEWMEVQL